VELDSWRLTTGGLAMMRKCSLRLLVLLVVAVPFLLLSTGSGRAGDRDDRDRERARGAVKLLKTIPVPVSALNSTAGALYSFDISFVDQATGTYYLADRSNKAVDVLNANTESSVTQIFPNNGHAGFAGFVPCSPPAGANDCAGPNGVVAAFPWLFVTDAPSRVLTFDLRTNTTVSEVTALFVTNAQGRLVPEPTRADELAYDPKDGLLLVINNASTPPVATLIKVNQTNGSLSVVTNIFLDTKPGHGGVDAQNGAEQPVWDPGTQKFFLSIPQIGPQPEDGGVLRISTAGVVEATYPVKFCSPAGLALGPNEDLLVGCNLVFDTEGGVWTGNADIDKHSAAPQLVIIDAKTGNIDKHVRGAGAGDEVWFNKGDGNYYAASSGSPFVPNAITPPRVGTPPKAPPLTAQGAAILSVIDAKRQKLLQLVPTLNVPAVVAPAPNPHPAGTAHSVAANARNNHVFVPLAANNAFPNCLTGCIAVYGRPSEEGDDD
jgi:hypothetical protein